MLLILQKKKKKKKTDFEEKLKKKDKIVTLNKTRYTEVNTELDDLEEKVKIISTKGLTADMINKYSILSQAKYFSPNVLQNYLVFLPIDLHTNILLIMILKLNC